MLDKIRLKHLKNASTSQELRKVGQSVIGSGVGEEGLKKKKKKNVELAESFEELGVSDELMNALREMGISEPTEIQCIGVPAVLDGRSVVLGSHTGSGKTLAYMLPLVQLMRQDELVHGMMIKPRRPRAVVLCPTRELCEQVFRVAKSVSHHARFRSTMVSGGGRIGPQEDILNAPIDMIVGTPGRVLQHIEDGNIVYGDIKYLVLDEADTMFDRGFGPDIRKFVSPLNNRAAKPGDPGFQTILVTATMTKGVQMLVDEEFQGIEHLRTSTLHKKIASARHDFIKLTGSENKLEALMQVLEPSLAKGNRVMVFCNTLGSSRAVDHYLSENQISTVNYHGEVPAEQRVENLKKFKSDDGDCPTLVCTDLAARGLDLDVDHVIMFDFPKNSVDYLHRTGRTARMGAKGKVTSLLARKDVPLATRIEVAISKNESLESLSVDGIKRDAARSRITEQKTTRENQLKESKKTGKDKAAKSSADHRGTKKTGAKPSKAPTTYKAAKKGIRVSKTQKSPTTGRPNSSTSRSKSSTSRPNSPTSRPNSPTSRPNSSTGRSYSPSSRSSPPTSSKKINVVGFRGRSSSTKNETSM